MMRIENHIAIYLIDDKEGAVMKALRDYIEMRDAHREKLRAWVAENAPKPIDFMIFRDGRFGGVDFGGETPKGWKQPKDGRGSFPFKNNPVRESMEQLGKFEPASQFLEPITGEIYDHIRTYKNGECTGSSAIGIFINGCIGFLWAGQGKEAPQAVWTIDYEKYLREFAKELSDGETQEPSKDYRINLPGCHRIPDYEWERLCAEYEAQNKEAKQ